MTGPVTSLDLAPGSKDYRVYLVNFSKGTRNKFHAHSCDQVLIVTSGKGVVANEQEENTVATGDVIFSPREKYIGTVQLKIQNSHIYLF